MWSRHDPVSLFGAWGPCKTGWHDLSRTYRWVGSRFSDGETSYPLEVIHAGSDLAYTAGDEQGQVSIDGAPPRPVKIRVTHIYRLEEGQWKWSTVTRLPRRPMTARSSELAARAVPCQARFHCIR